MNKHFKSKILSCTGASDIGKETVIQQLWSGYGKIIRVQLIGASVKSVIVKHVQFPTEKKHPRGWNTNFSHERKVKSYQIESKWYQDFSSKSSARIPQCFGIETHQDEVFMILEDLDSAGFHLRKYDINWIDIDTCLEWLAKFHASFIQEKPKGLWEMGTYWHLATRPDELQAIQDDGLKAAAPLIDAKLNLCKYQTLVHGDAKLANFCFSPFGHVAAVDFQYVGGGCGMKDVAYFIGSCLEEEDCEQYETKILDTYFNYLQQHLNERNEELEKEWRSLYHVAWADFHRFLKGWSPDHWKINSYSERITKEVINQLEE